MIRFEDVSKQFGSRMILDSANLDVKQGEFITITGPSGSGKTTLVHLLIGADQPTSGKIFVDDIDIHSLDHDALQEYRREIGVVFQDYKLLLNKSVFDNVAYGLQVTGTPEYTIFERVPRILEKVGLHKHIDHYPHQLSGGEAQRTALARALVHEPKLLIADEPTGNLDPENARSIMKLLIQLNLQGITVFLVTHNPELLKLTPKRVLEIKEGKITER